MPQSEYIADTVGSFGAAIAAPASNALIVTSGTLAKGTYHVLCSILVTGAAETQPMNVYFADSTTAPTRGVMFTIQNIIDNLTVNEVTVDGTTALQLRAISNATAATVYSGRLTVTRVA